MSVDVCTEPAGLDVESDDDSFDHIVCCNPNKSLCGRDVADLEWVDPGEDRPEDECVVCADLAGRSCGVPFCKVRSWWRHRRSS